MVKAKLALDLANIRNSETNAITTLQTNGLRAGIKQLTVDMSLLYGASVRAAVGMGVLRKGMAIVAGTARAAGAAFAFLGVAIMGALNIIGLIVMAGYMLYEAWKWFIDSQKSDAENSLTAAAENAQTALGDF